MPKVKITLKNWPAIAGSGHRGPADDEGWLTRQDRDRLDTSRILYYLEGRRILLTLKDIGYFITYLEGHSLLFTLKGHRIFYDFEGHKILFNLKDERYSLP